MMKRALAVYKIFLILIFSLGILSPLSGGEIVEKIIFSADKNRTEVISQLLKLERIFHENNDAIKMKQKYKLMYKEIQIGDYYALTIYPIKSIEAKESIVLFLKPYFSDIFVVNSGYIERGNIVVTDSSQLESKLVLSKWVEGLYGFLTLFYYWLDKWHAIVVLLLLGGFFYYRRHNQLSQIDTKYHELAQHQDRIEEKFKER